MLKPKSGFCPLLVPQDQSLHNVCSHPVPPTTTDIDNECKRSLGSDREITLSIGDLEEGCLAWPASCPAMAVRESNEWGKSWPHDMQARRHCTLLASDLFPIPTTPAKYLSPSPNEHLETLLAVFIQNASGSMCLKCIMCHSGLRQRQNLWKEQRRWECPEFVLSLLSPSHHTRLGQAIKDYDSKTLESPLLFQFRLVLEASDEPMSTSLPSFTVVTKYVLKT